MRHHDQKPCFQGHSLCLANSGSFCCQALASLWEDLPVRSFGRGWPSAACPGLGEFHLMESFLRMKTLSVAFII